MTTFQIVEAQTWHCGQMVRILREEHRAAIQAEQVKMHHQLRACFNASAYRRAWLIDGQLAGLGGVTGPMLTSSAYVWLAVSQRATRYPVAMMREARRQIDGIMQVKNALMAVTLGADKTAERFASHLGFFRVDINEGLTSWMLRAAPSFQLQVVTKPQGVSVH